MRRKEKSPHRMWGFVFKQLITKSLTPLKNLIIVSKSTCPNYKVISESITALDAVSPSDIELESAAEKRISTGHAPIDRCLRIANPEITNWVNLLKILFLRAIIKQET